MSKRVELQVGDIVRINKKSCFSFSNVYGKIVAIRLEASSFNYDIFLLKNPYKKDRKPLDTIWPMPREMLVKIPTHMLKRTK